MKIRHLRILAGWAGLVCLCAVQPAAAAQQPALTVAMANPASVFCGQNGGGIVIRKDATGGEVGFCVFPDKSECEEFAFMRGECQPGAKPAITAAGAGESSGIDLADPFAYCAMIGNLDAPDARWTGAKLPDAVLAGLNKVTGLAPAVPAAVLAQSSFWRCMDNKVYACTVGANLPCQERADLNDKPTTAMTDFCVANPMAVDIPAVVTGRATVYAWKCANGQAEAGRQLFKPDARGFIADFWYEIGK